MKSKNLLLCSMATLATTATALAQQPAYDVINLGTPLNGNFAIAAGISPARFVNGYRQCTQVMPVSTPFFGTSTKPRTSGPFGGLNSALLNQFSGFSEAATKDPYRQGEGAKPALALFACPLRCKTARPVALPLLSGNNGAAFGNNDLRPGGRISSNHHP